tara:strand:+ start:869 stop:1462 length:594 start_codon:yes stop_codon:yes gene_type:complete
MSLKDIETTVLDLDWDKISNITKNIKPKEFYVEEAFFFPTDRNRTEDKSTALYAKKTGITQWHSKDYPEVKECVPKKYFEKFGIKYSNAVVKINSMKPGMFSHPHIDRYNGFKQKANPDKKIKKVRRVWVCVTSHLGHAFFLDKDRVAYGLPRGTAFLWHGSTMHSGCNAGLVDRYWMSFEGEPVEEKSNSNGEETQ